MYNVVLHFPSDEQGATMPEDQVEIALKDGTIFEIASTWLDDDGTRHMIVSVHDELEQEVGGDVISPDNNPLQSNERFIAKPKDHLTRKEKGEEDDTLDNDKRLEKAHEEIEEDFDDAADKEGDLRKEIKKSYDIQRNANIDTQGIEHDEKKQFDRDINDELAVAIPQAPEPNA